jgi:hypothetical protein
VNEEEPRRLLDDPATSDALRAALSAGRDELPDATQLASLSARLGPLLGPGGGAGGGGAGGAGGGGAAAGGTTAGAAKVIGALAAAAAVGGAIWYGVTPDAPRAPPRERAPEVEVSIEPPVIAPIEESIPEGLDPPVAPDPPRVRAEPRPALETDPDAELALIRSAQDALRSSPARALELTAEHERRFGEGTLAQEREVVAIDALARASRADDARARAQRFHARWPRSAHRRRIDVLVPP